VLQPTLSTGLGDLSLAVDYFDIKVNNGVARAGTSNILAVATTTRVPFGRRLLPAGEPAQRDVERTDA
jgi:hypothetical protein